MLDMVLEALRLLVSVLLRHSVVAAVDDPIDRSDCTKLLEESRGDEQKRACDGLNTDEGIGKADIYTYNLHEEYNNYFRSSSVKRIEGLLYLPDSKVGWQQSLNGTRCPNSAVFKARRHQIRGSQRMR